VRSDNIYLVTTEDVESDDGDHLGVIMDYVQEVFGSDYEYYQYRGYDISDASGQTPGDLHEWWKNDPYTDSDRNLLIADANKWDEGGEATKPGNAAVVTVYKGMSDMAGPSADPDLIGEQPVSGYAAPLQVAIAIHELGHLFLAEHTHGVADNHNYVNYTSPMMASYADDRAGDNNECGDKIEHSAFNENRYVEGFCECTVHKAYFNHEPAKTYTKSEISSL
jgi:hypothetical protein